MRMCITCHRAENLGVVVAGHQLRKRTQPVLSFHNSATLRYDKPSLSQDRLRTNTTETWKATEMFEHLGNGADGVLWLAGARAAVGAADMRREPVTKLVTHSCRTQRGVLSFQVNNAELPRQALDK